MYTSVRNVPYIYDKAGNTTPDQVEGRLYDGGSNMYAYDGENRLITVTKTGDALSAACDTSLTLTTGGTGEVGVCSRDGSRAFSFWRRSISRGCCCGGRADFAWVRLGRISAWAVGRRSARGTGRLGWRY
ncbi:MAG: hypothetical protein JW955_16960 [Sedimentisphaerales bacterium]|nr:hypothetical protein [Sedimentisphaerales bacterium]